MEQKSYDSHEVKIIDSSQIFVQETHDKFPTRFIWPKDHSSETSTEVLNEFVIDLKGFLQHDKEATINAANLVKESCVKHGFFQIVNHGIDPALLALVDAHGHDFFRLPISEKLKCKKKDGSVTGFTSAHSDRFFENLPWKEMLSLEYHENDNNAVIEEYFNSTLGSQYKEIGLIYQKFCQSMKNLALNLLELLEISLGVDGRNYYRQLYENSVSLVRCNYYPKCSKPELTYGVGPHCDPTTLTVLYQDQIGGLEVFVDNKWKAVKPHQDALVINIGDTFKALSNGKYKSCLHRVMVNTNKPRISLPFFLCPKGDKVLKPHPELVERDGRQMYPNFKWEEFLHYTQKYHRADEKTLEEFTEWLLSSKKIPMH